MHVFDEMVTSRNTVACNMFSYPSDLFKKPPAVLDQWLVAFIMEVRKGDGTRYSPDSLQCLVAGLQCYLRENLGRQLIISLKSETISFQKEKCLRSTA